MKDDWSRVLQGLRSGEPDVLEWFCRHYQASLHRLADKRLAAGLKARVGPEDVVQSAFRTFLRRAEEGQFTLPDSDQLWRLLCTITLNKARKHARFHLRQKRTIRRDVHIGGIAPAGEADEASPYELPDGTADPAAQVAFRDAFEHLLESLGDEGRTLVELKLQHLTNGEIADQLGCSERTVRRMLKRIRNKLEAQFSDLVG